MNLTAALLFVVTTLSAIPVVAELAIHTPAAFPTNISAAHATPTGVYVIAGSHQLWFVEPTGSARQVPLPLQGRLEHTDFEPSGGLLWGCTRSEVFATNAAGAWQSWGLGEDPARTTCSVAPSPSTTWVVANSANENDVFVDLGAVGGGDLTLALERHRGAQFSPIGTDEAGGFWAIPNYPHTGIAHFDGASFRVWTPNRLTFAGTDFIDVFPFDRPVHPQVLAADGTGGVVAANPTEFVFMRSTAPYPNAERTGVQTPGFGLPGFAMAVGSGRIWSVGLNEDSMVLASWDFSGRLVGAEPIPQPKWFEPRSSPGAWVVSADAHGVWVAKGAVLFHRHSEGWSVFASSSTIDVSRREKRRHSQKFWQALPLVVSGTMASALAPALWGPRLGVPYARGGGETLGAFALGVVSPYVSIVNDVWAGDWRTPFMLTFGLVLSTGIATVATLTPEAALVGDDEPFPVGGALLGGAIGYTTGALVDLVLEAAGVESAFGRAVLWSSFTAIGAPLGFHALRGPLGAD